MEEILLSDDFLLYPTKNLARLSITNSTITIKHLKKNAKDEKISLNDVIGCQILKGNKTTHAKWYLCIFSYPLRKKVLKGLTRCRTVRSFGVATSRSNEENKQCVNRWKLLIKCVITGKNVLNNEVNSLIEPKRRNFIVYVNPFGGQGKAMEMYNQHVKPMFAEAEIQHVVVKTEYAGHAKKMTRELHLEEYDGIIIVSGDGLVHEVINGLMERQDWDTAIKTPLGVIPGGSGNALAAAVVYASTSIIRSNDLIYDALFEIVRGRTRDLSLYYAEAGNKSFYSFLNFGWGFVADVDIESEKYRILGNARFTLGCLVRLANMRRYHGMISYLPAENHHLKELNCFVQDGSSDDDDRITSHAESLLEDASAILTPSARCDVTDTTFVDGSNSNRNGQTETLLDKSSASISPTPEDVSPAAPIIPLEADTDSSTSDLNQKPFNLQRPLSESLPSEWKSVEDDFVFITPTCLSHIGQDMFMMPCAKMDEDVMYIYCVKSTVSKADFLQILLNISKGTHFQLSPRHTLVLPCRAFRLNPFTSHTGYMTADGELIRQQPLQATVTNIKAKVLCSSPP